MQGAASSSSRFGFALLILAAFVLSTDGVDTTIRNVVLATATPTVIAACAS